MLTKRLLVENCTPENSLLDCRGQISCAVSFYRLRHVGAQKIRKETKQCEISAKNMRTCLWNSINQFKSLYYELTNASVKLVLCIVSSVQLKFKKNRNNNLPAAALVQGLGRGRISAALLRDGSCETLMGLKQRISQGAEIAGYMTLLRKTALNTISIDG